MKNRSKWMMMISILVFIIFYYITNSQAAHVSELKNSPATAFSTSYGPEVFDRVSTVLVKLP